VAFSVPRKMTPEMWAMVNAKLEEGWSPERISNWFRLKGISMAGREWIYRRICAKRSVGVTGRNPNTPSSETSPK